MFEIFLIGFDLAALFMRGIFGTKRATFKEKSLPQNISWCIIRAPKRKEWIWRINRLLSLLDLSVCRFS